MKNREHSLAVYVATHGPKCRKLYNYCIPIEVGADLRKDFLYETRDNTGDHISKKNSTYNELTALYWMWKNTNHDVIGLYHYRRVFALSEKRIKNILKSYDYIAAKTAGSVPMEEGYLHRHVAEDWTVAMEELKRLYPDYYDTARKVAKDTILYACNMFITTKNNFDKYCEWLFPLLQAIENRVDSLGRDAYQGRYIGFLAERMWTIYLIHNSFHIFDTEIVDVAEDTLYKFFYVDCAFIRKAIKKCVPLGLKIRVKNYFFNH